MKTLVCEKPGLLQYSEQPLPVLTKGNAIIKIKRIGICGTDLHAFEGTQPYFSYPRILGHELAADLVEADGATDFVPGEALTFIPYFSCGTCIACRTGKPNCCTSIKVCGVHIDGGMAEYLSVPVDTLIKNRGLSYDELALVEPLAIGAHGIRRAAVQPGEFVLVTGAGPIGLAAMEFARIAGAQVIASDMNEARLAFCKEKIGIPHIIHPAQDNIAEELYAITGGDMPSVVIDATGSQRAINGALQWLAHGGRYVLIGLQKDELIFSHPEFHKRETTLMSSRNATRADFEYVMDCIGKKWINPAVYITHRVAFDAVKADFESWLRPASGVIKVSVSVD